MTVREAYKKGIDQLKDAGNAAPANDAGALLCFAAGFDRSFIYAHDSDVLDDACLRSYFAMLERRAAGEPLQYITRLQEFMSLTFEVGPGVLVPRQETELLVETVAQWCLECGKVLELLDVGTGSGCIAVSLAHFIPHCKVTAVDKMSDAIDIAKRNASLNGVEDRIEFIRSDLFTEIAGRQFDAIISNPPYIRSCEIGSLQREVRCHEPMEALDGGTDGLDFYRAIIGQASAFLKTGSGLLAFETGYDQAEDVAGLMTDTFVETKIYKDLAGIGRVVTGICR